MPIFNIIAAYTDRDGGMYEWEGEAADYDAAIAAAQAQAFEDNRFDGETEYTPGKNDMLSTEQGMSVCDVTNERWLAKELVELKDAAVQVAYEAIEAVMGELDGENDTGGTLGLLLEQARAVVERDKQYDARKATV